MGQQVQDCYRQRRCEGNGSFQALPGPTWQAQLCRMCWQPNARAARAGIVARVCSVPTHPSKTGTHQDAASHRIEEERQGEYPVVLIWEPSFSNHIQQPR